MTTLMEWIESIINNEGVFVVQAGKCYILIRKILLIATILGVPFPKAFIPICKKILTRLYRVFVHIYIHHFDKLVTLGAVSIT